ncbi:3-demethylubiquinone-9 3-methyltransferase [Actinokineospora sp. UTMC 2448]|nr:3-demethylubiquinone-9 3-methyltransferase [Actinokineospora sp. UTMC 2448]
MGKYDFSYSDSGPYSAAVRLLKDADLSGRVVLDLGCGSAPIAPVIAELGAVYVGIDTDAEALAALGEQGWEVHALDLTAAGLADRLGEIVADRSLAAVLCLDVLEHLPEPDHALAALADLADRHRDVELVVSIPNIAHVDIARRLLLGQWDMTESGLLDRTHLRFYTDRSLTAAMAAAGWHEAAREDFRLIRSDQHESGHPVFEAEANVGAFLQALRSGPDGYGQVNQFVRRYHRGGRRASAVAAAEPAPFLSIVIRTQGLRPDPMRDVLCCLAAQTDMDFEAVVVVHGDRTRDVQDIVAEFEGNLAQRVRVMSCVGGTRSRPANVGWHAARGEYVVFLDDDDLVTADWVATVRQGATEAPGRVIRWWAAEQRRVWNPPGQVAAHAAAGPLTPAYCRPFDFLQHVRQNETPFHCFAVPVVLRDLGVEFDERLTVCEDWEMLLTAASLCGVQDTLRTTSIYNKWSAASSSHSVHADEWTAMRKMVHVDLDSRPVLLPPGTIGRIDKALEERELSGHRVEALTAELAAVRAQLAEHQHVVHHAHAALAEMRASTSWKVAAPVRVLGNLGRRVARKVRGR